jgi:hypothetical protein
MLEPIPRYATKASIDYLITNLDLPNDYGLQDWSYQIANYPDIDRYLDHYKLITNEDHKFVLMEIIIQATEDQPNAHSFARYCSIIKDLLLKDFAIHQYTIYYWAVIDRKDLSNTWKSSPVMREIWHINEVATDTYSQDFYPDPAIGM